MKNPYKETIIYVKRRRIIDKYNDFSFLNRLIKWLEKHAKEWEKEQSEVKDE